MSSSCHIEMTLTEKEQTDPKPEKGVAQNKEISQKETTETKLNDPKINSAYNECKEKKC